MDRDWSVEVCVELKRLIRDKRATCSGRPERTLCWYKCIDRQMCQRSPRCTSRVRRHSYRGTGWANQLLLKFIIIWRYDGKEESEDTHCAKEVNPSSPQRRTEARQCPDRKSCQAYQ